MPPSTASDGLSVRAFWYWAMAPPKSCVSSFWLPSLTSLSASLSPAPDFEEELREAGALRADGGATEATATCGFLQASTSDCASALCGLAASASCASERQPALSLSF